MDNTLEVASELHSIKKLNVTLAIDLTFRSILRIYSLVIYPYNFNDDGLSVFHI